MMRVRLTFARRVGLIVWLSLMAVWLLSVILFVVSDGDLTGAARPLPAQIAAVVTLLEQAPAAERTLILHAVTSEQFTARIEPGKTVGVPAPDQARLVVVPALVKALAELSPRAVSVTAQKANGLFSRRHLQGPTWFEIRVALATGDTLVIDTRAVLMTSLFGLPAGFGVGLLGLLISIFALYAVHRQIRPLARLASVVDTIDPALEMPKLPAAAHAAPEIQALVGAFTRLQARLVDLLRARMALIGGVSHDVRTFATRLRLRVENIPDPEQRARAIADITDMVALLDDALTASRATAGELSEELLDLAAFVQSEVADRHSQGAPVHVTPPAGPGEILVLADRLALRRILSNLIENALTYGNTAALTVRTSANHAVLTVDDTGPGIPADQRTGLLEPFVRMETSRSRSTGGAGLGLAVVNTLVRALGGEIVIGEAQGGGARITIRIPLFAASTTRC